MFSLMQDTIVNLKKFKLIENILYIEGIGIILGQNAKEWKDIDYKLVFKGNSGEYIKQLGKANHTALTQKYATGTNFCYDKCWFATQNYQGVDISDIPIGDYKLLLKISVNGFEKTIYLRAEKTVSIQNKFIEFLCSKDGNSFVIKRDLRNSALHTIDLFYVSKKPTNDKIKVDGYYQDENNNTIDAPAGLNNVHVQFFGKNNHVVLHKLSNLRNTLIEFKGDNGSFQIGEKAGIFGTFRIGYDSQIKIGNGTTSTNAVYVTCAEKTNIVIGNDCMFATNNQIRTDDSHGIYDVNTGKRVNPSKNITVGNHVWVAYGATILGGSEIGNGSVVGAYSLVKKAIPNNCVVAGIPAKVIKKDIFWERPLLLNEADEKVFTPEYLRDKTYIMKTTE